MHKNRYNKENMSTIQKKLNQAGMVSFMVTLIMMMVISLIVIGFSQVTRRNQRQALDRQLSAQAFYAAESGVNVTVASIRSYMANPTGPMNPKASCDKDYNPIDPTGSGAAITALDGGANVKYTCVLVDPNPDSLVYNASAGQSVVVPINTSSALNTLTFQWARQSGKTDSPCTSNNAYSFPDQASWDCGSAVLKIDMVVTPTAATIGTSTSTKTIYLTPYGSVSTAIGPDKVYVESATSCNTTCKTTLNLSGANSSSSYYLRINPIYRDAPRITITGTNVGGRAKFNGTQAMVDVTGQAQDELRRVQVRVKLTNSADSADIPLNALTSSNSICKHFDILPMPTGTVDLTNVCK